MNKINYNLYETNSGGSKIFDNSDIQVCNAPFSMIYSLIFGGNVESSTTGSEEEREQRSDFWGNSTFYGNNSDEWINSNFERAMRNTALNSEGRQYLEQVLNDDLKPLEDYGEFTATVAIQSEDRITINITFGSNNYQWDVSTTEITTDIVPIEVDYYEFSGDGETFNFSGDGEFYQFSNNN